MATETTEKDIGRYLKMRDVYVYFLSSMKTICKWIRKEGMPDHKIWKQWQFIQQELDEWVSSHNETGIRTRREHPEKAR